MCGVLVTAGGTREAIDPVRVITNRSSGKQGYALADEAARSRREGHAWSPPSIVRRRPGADVVRVQSAADMQAAVVPRAADQDVIIMAAAVADFRPSQPADRKIKKGDGVRPTSSSSPPTTSSSTSERTSRPARSWWGSPPRPTTCSPTRAQKLERKHLDLIVANDVSAPGVGFEHDTNQVVILSPAGIEHDGALSDKRAVARAVLDAVVAARANQ